MFGNTPRNPDPFYTSWKPHWEADNYIRFSEAVAQNRARRYGINWNKVHRTARIQGVTVVWEWYDVF